MSGTLPQHVTLRAFFGAYTGLPANVVRGTLPMLIEANDTATGQPVDVLGLSVRQFRPDGGDVTITSGIVRTAPGRYTAEITFDVAGEWRFEVKSIEPRPAETVAWARVSGPQATAAIVAADGTTIAGLPGNRPFDVRLITDLLTATPFLGGEKLIIVQLDAGGVPQARVTSLQAFRDDVGAAASEAEEAAAASALAAGASATGAAGSATQAGAARTGAETARTGAEAARDTAVGAKTSAETARDGAVTARGAAEGARDTATNKAAAAEASATGAASSATQAGAARTGAETARTGSETARDASVAAKDAAAGSAATATTQAGTATTKATEADTSAKGAAAMLAALPGTVPIMVGHVYSFRIGRYYQEWGAQRAVVPQVLADVLAVSRASIGGYFDAAGVYQRAANNVPRISYDLATLQPRGLLLAEARVNSATNPLFVGAVSGGSYGTGVGVSAPATGLTFACLGRATEGGQDGLLFSIKGDLATAGGAGRLGFTLDTFNIPAGGKGVASLSYRTVSGTPMTGTQLRFTSGSLSQGVPIATNALQRASTVFTSAAGATTSSLQFVPFFAAGSIDTVIFVALPEFIANATVAGVPIAPAPDTTGAAMRLADATLVPDLAKIGFSNGAHTFAARFRVGFLPAAGTIAGIWRADDGTDNERFRAFINPDGTVTVGVAIGGVMTQVTPAGTVAADAEVRLAAGFGLNGLKASLNGGPVAAGAPAGRPYAMSRLRLGSADLGGATSMLNGGLLDFAGRQGLLSDADLQGFLA